MVDERIAVSLSLEDCLVTMPLIVIHGEVLMPFEERGDTILRVLFRCSVDLSWVPQEKIQRRPRDRPPSHLQVRTYVLPVYRTDFLRLLQSQGNRNRVYFL